MDIAFNAEVYCTDGFYGRSIGIILNPTTEQVTHVVVQQEGLFSHTRLVLVTHIVNSLPDRIQLDLAKTELESKMPPFIKTEFLESDLPNKLYTTDLMWPRLIANLTMKTLERQNIPLDELAVNREATVEARDGAIGHLQDFIVNPDDKHVTHIVIRTGRPLAHSRIVIPVSAIDHFDEETVYLSLSRNAIEALMTP